MTKDESFARWAAKHIMSALGPDACLGRPGSLEVALRAGIAAGVQVHRLHLEAEQSGRIGAAWAQIDAPRLL
jgi:hypothetical protein